MLFMKRKKKLKIKTPNSKSSNKTMKRFTMICKAFKIHSVYSEAQKNVKDSEVKDL